MTQHLFVMRQIKSEYQVPHYQVPLPQQRSLWQELRKQVYQKVRNSAAPKSPQLKPWILLGLLQLCCFLYLLSSTYAIVLQFLLSAIIGILALPVILNLGHEAVHNNLQPKVLNTIGKGIFYTLGTSGYFWELRHLASHHSLVNVVDFDLDIEQSKLIRLSEQKTHAWHHSFQHIYMPIAFLFYTLNWFFYRDFKDLSRTQFGKIKLDGHPRWVWVSLFAAKAWHLLFFIGIPIALGGEALVACCSFFLFHFSASFVTTFLLVSTHIGEHQEVISSEKGELPYCWLEHQLRTTADFSTHSRFATELFGGFNHHVAHHLFPQLAHTHYPVVTPLIRTFCHKNGLPYHAHPNLFSCSWSHLKRLKILSENL